MKTIIAGSREITDYECLLQAIEKSGIKITEVVSGACRGVDKMGERYAKENGIKCQSFPADWNKYKKAAGFIRNAEMAEYADAAIILWDKQSRGTLHMIKNAQKLGLELHVFSEVN